MIKLISTIIGAISNIVFIMTAYYLMLSFFGLYKAPKKKNYAPTKKFALIIAAHNEERVVSCIVESLKKLDYPKEMYDIFLVADNCTDKTAEIGKKAGALVYERFSEDKKGKGYAMEWIFNIIFKMKKKYDAVAIFDADNLASKNFLKEMNNKLCDGYSVVQGYLDSKNPKDSWITGGYSISFWQSNRMIQMAKYNLSLSNQLGGTGFCISIDTLKKLGWGATCLTEDLEFSCKLVMNGERVGWAHDAVIYDEKPITLKASWFQRKRWMQGFADVSSRYFFKLLKKGIMDRSWTAIDCALYSIQPYFTLMLGVAGINTLYMYISSAINGNFSKVFDLTNIYFIIFGLGFILLQIFLTPYIMWLDKKISLKSMWHYVLYPFYSITWIPISFKGILDKNKKEWAHTLHTRDVDISEIEKLGRE